MAGQNYQSGDGQEVGAIDRLADVSALTRSLRRLQRAMYAMLSLHTWFDTSENAVARYRHAMEDIRQSAESSQVPLVLCTMAANILDWAPQDTRLSAEGRQLLGQWAKGQARAAEEGARRSVESQDETRDAALLFLTGHALFRSGDLKNARYYLSRARDIDSENRISEAQNDFLRGLGGRGS